MFSITGLVYVGKVITDVTVYVCTKYGSRFKVVWEYKPQINDKRNNCWFLKEYVIWHVGTGGDRWIERVTRKLLERDTLEDKHQLRGRLAKISFSGGDSPSTLPPLH